MRPPRRNPGRKLRAAEQHKPRFPCDRRCCPTSPLATLAGDEHHQEDTSRIGMHSAAHPQKDSVKVAVNIRPLIASELHEGCTDCVTVTPGEPQLQIGPHVFTFDHVYGSSGPSSSLLFEQCMQPLIHAWFSGYNATVLAYGQTGSGKSYTMGTDNSGEGNRGGIIPQVMDTIFRKVGASKDGSEFLIRVSIIEIFKEDVFDLLDANQAAVRLDVGSMAKASAPCRVPIQIRETATGGITLAGVTEAEVKSKEEMASYLTRGCLLRATGSTNMNRQSSRSHAIFTISLEQKRASGTSDKSASSDYDIISSKFHLVDLAGSERAKRTGADGLRLEEGIHINKGLLALGNVISALGDEKERKERLFVPYRGSKLTRLLQDSLGGNSKTVMIACVSPADINAEETINTLKYANRARNIQNKAVVNRDPATAEMQKLRSQLEQLQTELLLSDRGMETLEEIQLLQKKVSILEQKNSELNNELKERALSCEQLKKSAQAAQLERDLLRLKIESARNRKLWDDIESADNDQDMALLKGYLLKKQQLESQLKRQNVNVCRHGLNDQLAVEQDTSLNELGSECEVGTPDFSSEVEEEKEREHSTIQYKLDKELQELDKRLQQKGVHEPKKKQETHQQLLERLPYVQHLKSQKVQLQKKIKQDSKQYRSWKSACEKEVVQLKKVERKNENMMQKLVAMNQKQEMVLRSKTKEVADAKERSNALEKQLMSLRTRNMKLVIALKNAKKSASSDGTGFAQHEATPKANNSITVKRTAPPVKRQHLLSLEAGASSQLMTFPSPSAGKTTPRRGGTRTPTRLKLARLALPRSPALFAALKSSPRQVRGIRTPGPSLSARPVVSGTPRTTSKHPQCVRK